MFPEPPSGEGTSLAKHHLPIPPTPLIGREQEVMALCHTLRRPDVRLLTLTGVAGVGKTRLALQVSTQLLDDFADGILFVSLAPINDPDLVIATIARTIGLIETAHQPMLVLLKAFLAQKHLLLVLDNFEQVVQAAPLLAELLEACPTLKLLVTSRELLRLRTEHHYVVAPLALPDLKHLPDVKGISRYAAVALLVQSAQAIQPDFQVTSANARVIAEICIHLEGLPLAIELAVARLKLLSLPALLARLRQRLELLTGGARDLPERQQTLHATLQWSYDLLSAQEQELFRSLSIFVKGCTLEAVKEVFPLHGDRIVDSVSSLVDKSLVQPRAQADGELRLHMLETIREYGLTCLQESGELEAKRQAHAHYYLLLAEEAEPHLREAGQMTWSRKLEGELENLRAALAYLIEREETELALRLSGALWRFWYMHGHWKEGARWLELILQLPPTESQGYQAMRARALYSAAMLTHHQGEAATTQAFLQESLRLHRALDEKRDLAELLGMLGTVASRQGDLEIAQTWLEESVRVAREVDDRGTLTYALFILSITVHYQSDPARVVPLIEESMALFQELENAHRLWLVLTLLAYRERSLKSILRAATLARQSPVSIGEANNPGHINWVLVVLAGLTPYYDDTIQSGEYAQEDWSRLYEVCNKNYLTMALTVSGSVKQKQGDFEQAAALHREGLALGIEIGSVMAISWSLYLLARVATARAQPELAARLLGALESLFDLTVDMESFELADYENTQATLRKQLGEERFLSALAEGRTKTPKHILADLELMWKSALTASPTRAVTLPLVPQTGLTSREMDVLRLLAQGLTSAQIAKQLIIGVVTVNFHVRSIYSKLGVTSRAAATRYAVEHHLV